jgi:hypothetical protein
MRHRASLAAACAASRAATARSVAAALASPAVVSADVILISPRAQARASSIGWLARPISGHQRMFEHADREYLSPQQGDDEGDWRRAQAENASVLNLRRLAAVESTALGEVAPNTLLNLSALVARSGAPSGHVDGA